MAENDLLKFSFVNSANSNFISGAGVPQGPPHRGHVGLRGHRHPAAGDGQLSRVARLRQPQGRRLRQIQVSLFSQSRSAVKVQTKSKDEIIMISCIMY